MPLLMGSVAVGHPSHGARDPAAPPGSCSSSRRMSLRIMDSSGTGSPKSSRQKRRSWKEPETVLTRIS